MNVSRRLAGRSRPLASLLLAGCCAERTKDDRIVLGFSQIGAESEWRTANTESIKSAAATMNIDLRFADAQQKQENQIKALRSFIAQKVDVIAFSPVVETGWDTVLQEAKAAKIPVILTDRAVTGDPSLYVGFIGSDFVEEGRKAGRWVGEKFKDATDDVNIVELQGTVGSAPGQRSQEGLRGNHRRESAPQDHPLAVRRLHARQGQGSHGSLPQGRVAQDPRAVRAQRRHGHRRDPGHRGSGHQARQGNPGRLHRRGERRVRGDDRRQAQRHHRVQSLVRARSS